MSTRLLSSTLTRAAGAGAGAGARAHAPTAASTRRTRPVQNADGTGGGAPVPPSALELLDRSDAELMAAQLAGSPDDQFLHAHLAAIRVGAALLQVTGRPTGRPAPRTVWEMVALVAPELADWAAFFADGAATRSALEAGRDGGVDQVRAERTVGAAEDFQDAVRALLDPQGGTAGQRRLALRAS